MSVTAQPLASNPRNRASWRRGELQARVAREGHFLSGVPLEVSAERLPKKLNIDVQQLGIGHAADVIFPKNRGFEHEKDR